MNLDKNRPEEIEELYIALNQVPKKFKKYFDALALLPSKLPENTISIEYGNTSIPSGEVENAKLKSNIKRD